MFDSFSIDVGWLPVGVGGLPVGVGGLPVDIWWIFGRLSVDLW